MAAAGRACPRRGAGRDGVARQPGRRLRRLQAGGGPHLRAVRADPLRRLRHRGHLCAAGVPPPAAGRRDQAAAGQRGAVSRADPRRRRLRPGQVPAPDRAAPRGWLGPPDLPAWRAGPALRRLRAARRPAGGAAAGDGGEQGGPGGCHCHRAPGCYRRSLGAPPGRTGGVPRLRLDAGAAARPVPRGGVAASDQRPRRLGGAEHQPSTRWAPRRSGSPTAARRR